MNMKPSLNETSRGDSPASGPVSSSGDVNVTSENGHPFGVTRFGGNVSEFRLFYVAPVGAALEFKWPRLRYRVWPIINAYLCSAKLQ